MIRMRIDDVMTDSSAYDREKSVRQFRKVHRWLAQIPDKAIHIPTILVTEIQEYPEIIELVRDEAAEGRMVPQLHGYEHIDYGKLTQVKVEEHLDKSIEWFKKNLNTEPTVWATPWGGNNEAMSKAAAKYYLQLETTEGTMTPSTAIHALKVGKSLTNGQTIMEHWWKRGLNLLRLVEILKYGYKEALRVRKDLW